LLFLTALLASVPAVGAVRGGQAGQPAEEKTFPAGYWIEPMKKVHAHFTGTRGTFAHFGDSIAVSDAFWSRLRHGERRNMSTDAELAYARVNGYMKPECWDRWKGADHGNGEASIRWAHAQVDSWLKKLNPEVVLLLFGTHDLPQLDVAEYEQKTREVAERCLANGTIVILATSPPRSGMLEKSQQFAEAVRKIAGELKVPLVDFHGEVLKRRPDDWDGTLPQFQDRDGDEYQVPTLIARDGIHPSNPSHYADYAPESLRNNGYALLTVLTLTAYADVIQHVLQTTWADRFRSGQWLKQVMEVAAILGAVFVVVFFLRRRLLKAGPKS
jgi:hypothetical protein